MAPKSLTITKSIAADTIIFEIILGVFFPFYIDKVCCVYSLKLPLFNEAILMRTRHILSCLRNSKRQSLLCLLSWHYEYHLLAQTYIMAKKVFEPLKFHCSLMLLYENTSRSSCCYTRNLNTAGTPNFVFV